MNKSYFYAIIISILSLSIMGCERGPNIFTVNQDIAFGQQVDSIVEADYSVLDPDEYEDAYFHINRIFNNVLVTDDMKYKDRFPWQVKIIQDDETLNAFAAPGGFLYFYTGLIKYLDDEAHLAGVMAHEIAHADLRHSTRTMTKVYGYSLLLNIILGKDSGELANIASDLALGLGSLKFSRDHEYEADRYSVQYLEDTEYNPRGIKGFFEKLIAQGLFDAEESGPAWLSTHPNPPDRLEAIDEFWETLGSPTGLNEENAGSYEAFKNSLP